MLGHEQAAKLRDRLLRTGELRDVSRGVHEHPAPSHRDGGDDRAGSGRRRSTATEHCDWCEQHPGEGEGLAFDEFDARYGVFDEGEDRDRVRAPGSESVGDVRGARREGVARDWSRSTTASRSSIVCHGGVVGCALEVLGGVPFGTLVRYVDNTSITELRRDDADRWWLVRLNDAAHLS